MEGAIYLELCHSPAYEFPLHHGRYCFTEGGAFWAWRTLLVEVYSVDAVAYNLVG